MDEHIRTMGKVSNREKILTEGMRVVHERGFSGASVRDIVQAAGVPQGSFTNHFASKEAFGLEVLDLYFANSCNTIAETVGNASLAPLDRLRAYCAALKGLMAGEGMRKGCMFGNFSAETGDCGDIIRHRLAQIFAHLQQSIAACIRAAAAAGEIADDLDSDELAGFIVSSLQGAILLAKAQRSLAPVERFEQILFTRVLRAA